MVVFTKILQKTYKLSIGLTAITEPLEIIFNQETPFVILITAS
jgi:hypothetical protein